MYSKSGLLESGIRLTSISVQGSSTAYRPSIVRQPVKQRTPVTAKAEPTVAAASLSAEENPSKGFLGIAPLTWQKIIPLGFMFFCILFNYTILRDTKVSCKPLLVISLAARLEELHHFIACHPDSHILGCNAFCLRQPGLIHQLNFACTPGSISWLMKSFGSCARTAAVHQHCQQRWIWGNKEQTQSQTAAWLLICVTGMLPWPKS